MQQCNASLFCPGGCQPSEGCATVATSLPLPLSSYNSGRFSTSGTALSTSNHRCALL